MLYGHPRTGAGSFAAVLQKDETDSPAGNWKACARPARNRKSEVGIGGRSLIDYSDLLHSDPSLRSGNRVDLVASALAAGRPPLYPFKARLRPLHTPTRPHFSNPRQPCSVARYIQCPTIFQAEPRQHAIRCPTSLIQRGAVPIRTIG